jgi:hypothetical protein
MSPSSDEFIIFLVVLAVIILLSMSWYQRKKASLWCSTASI